MLWLTFKKLKYHEELENLETKFKKKKFREKQTSKTCRFFQKV